MSPGYFCLLLRELDDQELRKLWPFASLEACLWNVNTDPKKRPRPFTPWDFIAGWKEKEEPRRPLTKDEAITLLGLDAVYVNRRNKRRRAK